MRRSATLDGLRGLAIASVVGFHALGTFAPRTLHPALLPLAGGLLGVDLFFVLSGYLLVHSWEQSRSLAHFWQKRLARILPPYWASLAVLLPLFAPDLLHQSGRLLLFVFVHSFLVPRLPWRVNAVYWSLTPEVEFYLLVPVLDVLMRRLSVRRTLVGVFAISLVWRALTTSHYHFPADLLPGRLDQFAAGMAAARSAPPSSGRARAAAWCSLVLAAVLVPAYGWVFWHTGGAPPHAVEALSHPVLGGLVAISLRRLRATPRVRPLAFRPLALLGLVSYSLYLWHLPILVAARHLGRDARYLWGGLGAALLLSTLSYALVERPVLRRRTAGLGPGKREPALTTWRGS